MDIVISSIESLADSFGKEFKNEVLPESKKDAQKLLVNAGLNILGKKGLSAITG